MSNVHDWLETALEWDVSAVRANWTQSLHGDGKAISDADATYVYYSPFRPLNWILDGIGQYFVVPTHKPGTDLLYCVAPLPALRLYKWELIPVSPGAREHAQLSEA